MVTDGEGRGHPPMGGYRVSTEEMADGRRIHYYEWPDEPEPGGASDEPPADVTAPGEGDDE